MKMREENKKILEKYNIKILDDVDEMLDFLSEYMADNCFYPGGDPKDSCYEIEKVYDNLIEDNIYNEQGKNEK